MITVDPTQSTLSVLRLSAGSLCGKPFAQIEQLLNGLRLSGQKAVLLDISVLRRARSSDLACLIELCGLAYPDMAFGVFGASPELLRAATDQGVASVVPMFANEKRARRANAFQGHCLTDLPAIVLCAGRGSRMAPLTRSQPKPMLDLMGRPILEHILRHLRRFGIQNITLNPGYLGPQIPDCLGSGGGLGQSIFYVPEGQLSEEGWVPAPIGSAATLRRLAKEHAALLQDTLVLCGDALVDLDIQSLVETHRRTSAAVTIAAQVVPEADVEKYGIIDVDDAGQVVGFQEKPKRADAVSCLANTGIYVFSPEIREHLDKCGTDIGSHFLPNLIDAGLKIQMHAEPFQWIDVGCGRDYARAWQLALKNRITGLAPKARQVAEDLWLGREAGWHPSLKPDGPVFVGAKATVEKGVQFRGFNAVGSQSLVSGGVLKNSIIQQTTHVQKSAWLDGHIVGPDWAVSSAFADGSSQPCTPLDGVVPFAQELAASPRFLRAG